VKSEISESVEGSVRSQPLLNTFRRIDILGFGSSGAEKLDNGNCDIAKPESPN
jgi:hypothetical protein